MNESIIICDDCNIDFTHSFVEGGIFFLEKAICPLCQDKWIETAEQHGELGCITHRAQEGERFNFFVIRIRNIR